MLGAARGARPGPRGASRRACASTWPRSACRRAAMARGATSARSSARSSATARADPPGVLVTPTAAEVLSDPASASAPVESMRAQAPDPTGQRTVTSASRRRSSGATRWSGSLIDGARRAAPRRRRHHRGGDRRGRAREEPRVPRAGSTAPRARGARRGDRAPRARAALGGAEQTVRDLLARALDLPAAPPAEGAVDLLRERLTPLRRGRRGAGGGGGPRLGGDRRARAGDGAGRCAPLEARPGRLRSALTVAAGEALRRRRGIDPSCCCSTTRTRPTRRRSRRARVRGARRGARAPIWICALGRPQFAEGTRVVGRARRPARRTTSTRSISRAPPCSAGACCCPWSVLDDAIERG